MLNLIKFAEQAATKDYTVDKSDLLAEFKAKNDIALLDAYKEIASLKILWRPLIDYLRYYFSYKFGTEPNPKFARETSG